MTLNFFKFVLLNYLLCFSASYDPLLGKAYNDSGAAIRGMANSLSRKRHNWQLANGEEVSDMTQYQFHAVVVANKDTDQESFCSGSVINDNTVITAGICVMDLNQPRYTYYQTENLLVFPGATDEEDITSNVQSEPVEQVKAINDYAGTEDLIPFEGGINGVVTYKQDLAVVQIKGSFLDNKNKITHIALPPTTFTQMVRNWDKGQSTLQKTCTVFGSSTLSLATTSALISQVPLKLYYAEVVPVNFQKCNYRTQLRGRRLNEKQHFCAVGRRKGVCLGGNGGGILCKDEHGTQFIAGIHSIQLGCGTDLSPMIFTRVDAVLDFINKPFGDSQKSAQSSGDCIHNQLVAHYYGTSLTSVLLVTHFIKSGS